MADTIRNMISNNGAFLQTAYKSPSSSSSNRYRLDEGYSEDTESRADSRMGDHEPQGQSLLPDWVVNMNETERSEFAYAILRSLRTSSIASIVDRLNPLLHIDPVLYLPPEITFEIFSHLDPQMLLVASTLSKSWRARTLDSRLWRLLFGSEGWNSNTRQVKDFEEEQRALVHLSAERKSRARPSEALSDAESKSPKKRVRERQFFRDGPGRSAGDSGNRYSPLQWAAQHDPVEADDDERMDDAPTMAEGADEDLATTSTVQLTPLTTPTSSLDLSVQDELDPPIQPSLLLNSQIDPSVNWQYLYKQKRRLEANWQAGRFKNFQLPHPKYPEEAHAECVYTIQYSRTHLVSGSRDKTLRIWNLETQRLVVKPLKGHDASVLCLQFDDSPEQDIVVSGGSDCHIILWRFSTGEMIRKLERAHSESVLNLRFNDRFLITCSKDKKIKIWNRKALLPTDDAYPNRGVSQSAHFPSYILNVDNLLEAEHTNIKPLKEYSLLMTLEGHNAAVNAIQILDSQIVSASGDRLVKIWDVKTGRCDKTLNGHAKGIACVQFDGRRIVSGSSDETVRIFDRVTGAEVACLKGHSNLVRTVQARFGDVPGSQLEEEAEARAIDRKFLTAKLSGALGNAELSKEERRARNAGGRDPKDIFAVGAMLPPGGGGSKWARIVSGSYDETVIIWRRGADGKWTPAHQFYQWEAVFNAGGRPRYVPPPHHLAGHGSHPMIHGQQNATGQALQVPQPSTNPAAAQLAQQMQTQLSPLLLPAQQFAGMTQAQVVQQLSAHVNHAYNVLGQQLAGVQPPTVVANHPNTTTTTPTAAATSSAVASQVTQTSLQQVTQLQGLQPRDITLPNGQTLEQAIRGIPNNIQAQVTSTLFPQQFPVQALPHHPPQGQHHQHPHHHQHGQHITPAHAAAGPAQSQLLHPNHPNYQVAAGAAGNVNNNPANNGTNSRVFKLQFDSRRIICCSQDPTIVGWDFANGDEEIEAASRFFGEDY